MDDLKRKRGGVKAKLTLFTKYLNSLNNQIQKGESPSELDILQVEQRIGHAENLVVEFEEFQNKIESEAGETELDKEYDERENFYSTYYSQMALAKHIISTYSSKNDNLSDITSNHSSKHCTKICQGAGIELKPIELPKFNGSYNNWLEFADLFESLVHKNESLDNIRRFHYLRNSLESGAAQVIRSLEFTSNNYLVAWNLIRERYDNKRILISNHVNALFNIDAIPKESSLKLRQLIDISSKHLYALKQLGQPTDSWDVLLNHIISSKFDTSTLRAWENSKAHNEVPSFEDLKSFLKTRADLLETLEINQEEKKQNVRQLGGRQSHLKNSERNSYTRGFYSSQDLVNRSCAVCKKDHIIYHCTEFMKLSPKEKFDKSREVNICTNCLKPGHFYRHCKQNSCKKCSSKHHTLLHPEKPIERPKNEGHTSVQTENINSAQNPENVKNLALSNFNETNQIILSTVLVHILDKNNKIHSARALLDCGSQSSFVSETLCEKLMIEKSEVNLAVTGINNTTSCLKYKCNISMLSPINAFQAKFNCFVVPEITGNIPALNININELKIPSHLQLADHSFYKAQKVDLLIGNDLFWKILCQGKFSLGKNKPFMQKTVFGWILAGPYLAENSVQNTSRINCNFLANNDIQNQLSRFWELEEVSEAKQIFSSEEVACEKHFIENTQRDATGRFIVTLPFKAPINTLGESFQQAKNRFLNLERKLDNNINLKTLYKEFIDEYKHLGHMKKAGNADDIIDKFTSRSSEENISYFMPHHGVLKENSLTTRLRVVFDCSAPTSNGISLNDIQMIGPTLQSDLFSILLRFRIHSYVVSADVEKMYRQVLVRDDQRSLQRILWRNNSNEPLEVYDLLTVTYGMKCSAYLAIKCLTTLGTEYEKENPKIANIIKSDFYVDDLLTGFDSKVEARELCKKTLEVLKGGGFPLRKFYSNDPDILETIDKNANFASIIQFGENENAKTLGLSWSPHSDTLLYNINPSLYSEKITKRLMLSDISQIFDPLGLLSACIIIAKIMLQKLWLERLSWDDPLPMQLQNSYLRFRSQLPILNNLKIPRHVRCSNAIHIELHGFSDAAMGAFGACIYIKSTDSDNKSYSHLICAKGKVAPIKPVTLPRLELCGAVILARLANKVINSLKIQFHSCYLWTDSTIVLSWIKTSANTLKTFVSNRVVEIQETTSFAQWRHVPSKDNPADLLSRGVEPEKIIDLDLWWQGPQWLIKSCENWPNIPLSENDVTENRKNVKTFVSKTSNKTFSHSILFERFSNLLKLKRCVAYVLRFIKICKTKTKIVGPLYGHEIHEAFNLILKLAQAESFVLELKYLTQGKALEKSSKILNLTPFLDSQGIIRVGGRLQNSEFAYNKKHPVILSSDHVVTKLIFEYYHRELMHAGPQLLLATIREFCWPLSGRNLARHTVHKCIECFRQKPKILHPIMGNLPAQRTVSGPPFTITGVDYAGPFLIRDRKGRGSKLNKSYICLFVCFNIKAVHIELVTELSKDSFLLAFKRFIARRGKPQQMFSDNGTNFVSASSELKSLQDFLTLNSVDLIDSLSKDNITWTFSPPYSPHFGGLWEAGVKTVKHHLRRVLGNAHLTYEEFYSVLVQIEAIMNSRPILPLSPDPNDLSPLTPAHFLIGKPLTTTPDPEYRQTPVNRLTRYQLIQQLSQHMWERWNKEYISELQKRTKWTSSTGVISENSLVLIKEDNLPPMKWRLGRVVEVCRGSDGFARVFKIKTASGTITRSFSKVCPLPLSDESSIDHVDV